MRRISWTRGMRLTADIMRDADNKVEEFVSNSLMLGAAGRFGLLPSTRPFKLALDFTQDCIEVTALSCLGLTRGGNLIDVNFGTDFTCTFGNRVSFPEDTKTSPYLLIIRTESNKRMEVSEGIEDSLYSFKLVPPGTRVEDNELPIGRIVYSNGWLQDDFNFVPPCLYVSSSREYEELAESFSKKIDVIDKETRKVLSSENRNIISVYWPIIRQLQIVMDKERELMTPMGLLSNVQKCLTAFICAFDVFDTPKLDEDAEQRLNGFVHAPYKYDEAYQRIKLGLDTCCGLIIEKVKALAEVRQSNPDPEPTRTNSQSQPPAPVVPEKELEKECIKPETIITFIYKDLAADIFFTTDGSKPNKGDSKAIKGRNGFAIKFDNGFRREKGKEDDRKIVLKLVALVNGLYSNVTTQTIILHKSLSFIDAIKI